MALPRGFFVGRILGVHTWPDPTVPRGRNGIHWPVKTKRSVARISVCRKIWKGGNSVSRPARNSTPEWFANEEREA
jgi:hypothetical protein